MGVLLIAAALCGKHCGNKTYRIRLVGMPWGSFRYEREITSHVSGRKQILSRVEKLIALLGEKNKVLIYTRAMKTF